MGTNVGLGLLGGGVVLLGLAPLSGSVLMAVGGLCWAVASERALSEAEAEAALAVVPVEPDRS